MPVVGDHALLEDPLAHTRGYECAATDFFSLDRRRRGQRGASLINSA